MLMKNHILAQILNLDVFLSLLKYDKAMQIILLELKKQSYLKNHISVKLRAPTI